MRIRRGLAVAVSLGISATFAAAAGLDGSTVSATGYYPEIGTAITNTVSSIVGPGVEFPDGSFIAKAGFRIVGTSIDVKTNQIEVDSLQSSALPSGDFNGSVFSFSGAPKIVGVAVDPSSTFLPTALSFTGDTVAINNEGKFTTAGQVLRVNVLTVPEPDAGVFSIAGMLVVGIGVIGRRRSGRKEPARLTS